MNFMKHWQHGRIWRWSIEVTWRMSSSPSSSMILLWFVNLGDGYSDIQIWFAVENRLSLLSWQLLWLVEKLRNYGVREKQPDIFHVNMNYTRWLMIKKYIYIYTVTNKETVLHHLFLGRKLSCAPMWVQFWGLLDFLVFIAFFHDSRGHPEALRSPHVGSHHAVTGLTSNSVKWRFDGFEMIWTLRVEEKHPI